MSSGDGSERATFGRLVTQAFAVIFVMAAVALLAWRSGAAQSVAIRHQVSEHAAQSYCAKADQKGCEELKSQVRSANAAETSAEVSIWQTAFNVLGLIGLGFTVIYARRAWLAAQVSAKAATEALGHTQADSAEQSERFRKQLKVASSAARAATDGAAATKANVEAMIAAQRPFLGVISFTTNASAKTPGCSYQFAATWKNSGQTAASKIRMVFLAHKVPSHVGLADVAIEYSLYPTASRAEVIPGDTFRTTEETITPDFAAAIWREEVIYMLFTRIEYEDVFGNPLFSEEASRVVFPYDPDKVGLSEEAKPVMVSLSGYGAVEVPHQQRRAKKGNAEYSQPHRGSS